MRKVIFAILGTVLFVAACTSTPIYNATNVPLSPPPNATMRDIERAIVRAGSERGWTMVPTAPGDIEGRLRLRGHLAVVDINYTRSDFSINYKDSDKLNYNGSTIHKNYNSWIHNLEGDIQREVAMITPSK